MTLSTETSCPDCDVAALRDRLRTMNECVRTHINLNGKTRAGWLEEEVAATDALLNDDGPMSDAHWLRVQDNEVERLRAALGRIASTEAPLSQNDLQIARDALNA